MFKKLATLLTIALVAGMATFAHAQGRGMSTKAIMLVPVDFYFPKAEMVVRVYDAHRRGEACRVVLLLYAVPPPGEVMVLETDFTLNPGEENEFNIFGQQKAPSSLRLTCEPGTNGNSVLMARFADDGSIEVR